MAEIKIQRKRRTPWWPVLLVLLIPLAWYLFKVRRTAEPATDVPARASVTAPGVNRERVNA
jgi:hypothetical protein